MEQRATDRDVAYKYAEQILADLDSTIVGEDVATLHDFMSEYYENTRGSGFDYAYRYPGYSRVLQAAGRVIRRDEDVGVVVLIDDRYATPAYTELFPSHWRHIQYAGCAENLAEMVREFWEDHPATGSGSPNT